MSSVSYLRPNNPGDPAASDLHNWSVELQTRLAVDHATAAVIDDSSPCDRTRAAIALAAADLILFFGHGSPTDLVGTDGASAVDKSNIAIASGRSLVAVACLAGRDLGPDAITAGVEVFLGWNAKLLWLAPPPGGLGEFGSAIVDSLAIFGTGASVEQVKERLRDELDAVAEYYRTGPGSTNPDALIAYYGAAAAAGQVAVCGNEKKVPL